MPLTRKPPTPEVDLLLDLEVRGGVCRMGGVCV